MFVYNTSTCEMALKEEKLTSIEQVGIYVRTCSHKKTRSLYKIGYLSISFNLLRLHRPSVARFHSVFVSFQMYNQNCYRTHFSFMGFYLSAKLNSIQYVCFYTCLLIEQYLYLGLIWFHKTYMLTYKVDQLDIFYKNVVKINHM